MFIYIFLAVNCLISAACAVIAGLPLMGDMNVLFVISMLTALVMLVLSIYLIKEAIRYGRKASDIREAKKRNSDDSKDA